MTQYEPLILVALGAILALIFVIIFSRVLWEAAVLVMRRRRENETPSKIVSLEAQRDQHRAEAAMASARMEATVQDVKERMALQDGEMSRVRNANLQLTQDVAQRDKHIEDQARELVKVRELLDESEQLAKTRADALKDLDSQLAMRGAEIAGYRGDIARLESEIETLKRAQELQSSDIPLTSPASSQSPEVTAALSKSVSTHEVPSQSRISMTQTPLEQIVADSKFNDQPSNVTELEPRRAKVLRKAGSGGLAEITERLKAMQRNPENT
jgi:chromosome segregation ATPase